MNNTSTGGNNKPAAFVNPLINKLAKINESNDNCATYSGIFSKCLFFLVMIIAGAFIAVYMKSTGSIAINPVNEEFIISDTAMWSLLISFGIFLILPFIAFIIKVTIPVTGALYCMSVGYLFGFFIVLDDTLGGYILLALALTIAVVAAMGFLYVKGFIKVTKKFRAVTSVLFSATILGGFLLTICYFIPALRGTVMMLTENPWISIGATIVGLVVAILFLLTDFETIRETVENKLPKKYEWFASFGLVFTVVWVYFKILQLVLEVTNHK